ncbi:MAG: cardiolipin synthase [Ruminococcus sp.]|uniref:cardiolipin synthase n=1 Tax=Ruminococcus sp. TaxID=41978 RepID=UPI0025FCF771|nr:cardiolipin synthase [Ruminococcus sp.]MCR5601520.1 cardiolipin synthase [Ruminococcus sp.]
MKLKKLLGNALSSNAAFVILLLLQILFLTMAVFSLGERFVFVYFALIVLDIVLIVYITNKNEPISYRVAWIIIISIFPILGGVSYLFLKMTQQFPKSLDIRNQERTKELLLQDSSVMAELGRKCPDSLNLARYVNDYGLYPVYRSCYAEYFPIGEEQFERLLSEIEKAEKFVFLEFFIITDGYMFGKISELLIRKAKSGVDVRLMYDGIGTGMLNSVKPFRNLEKNGVKCKVFNPFRPMISSVQNNRDHRKIVIIDGHTAFNGGTNLADEYINRKERFGHWKDTAVMISGQAVWNYTVMFLQLWENTDISEVLRFQPVIPRSMQIVAPNGFIQPFSDSPLDEEPVGKRVYLELINNAREYVCITTPYLILDEEMINALGFAAKKGVDVRIITPHIPDKWYVHMIAWNNYAILSSMGVRIYEYTPGFIHAKTCVADGRTAVVGTINFDYRSFYLHFECGTVLYECPVISDIIKDFEKTAAVSHLVTVEECNERSLTKKIAGAILNMFAPLL